MGQFVSVVEKRMNRRQKTWTVVSSLFPNGLGDFTSRQSAQEFAQQCEDAAQAKSKEIREKSVAKGVLSVALKREKGLLQSSDADLMVQAILEIRNEQVDR